MYGQKCSKRVEMMLDMKTERLVYQMKQLD